MFTTSLNAIVIAEQQINQSILVFSSWKESTHVSAFKVLLVCSLIEQTLHCEEIRHSTWCPKMHCMKMRLPDGNHWPTVLTRVTLCLWYPCGSNLHEPIYRGTLFHIWVDNSRLLSIMPTACWSSPFFSNKNQLHSRWIWSRPERIPTRWVRQGCFMRCSTVTASGPGPWGSQAAQFCTACTIITCLFVCVWRLSCLVLIQQYLPSNKEVLIMHQSL